jgi:hypothetical protein
MKRFMVGTAVSLLLILAACSGDPTEPLRGGLDHLLADPSQLVARLGRTSQVTVTGVDGQGNPLAAAFTVTARGPGLTVSRDVTYLPIYNAAGNLVPPSAATSFRFNVLPTDLVNSSFTISADGKELVVPVLVLPDPAAGITATTTASGSSARDIITLSVPAPYAFQGSASVAFGNGNAVVLGRSEDATSLQILALPGTVGPGTISGAVIDYAPTIPLDIPTEPVTVDATLAAQPGTDDPSTAPAITIPAPGEQSGFVDGGSFAAADCSDLSGAPCQLYAFSLAEDTDLHMQLTASDPVVDLGLYFINAADGSLADPACDDHGQADEPEVCDLSFPAGDYLMAVVSFGPFYPVPDPDPEWVAVQISTP